MSRKWAAFTKRRKSFQVCSTYICLFFPMTYRGPLLLAWCNNRLYRIQQQGREERRVTSSLCCHGNKMMHFSFFGNKKSAVQRTNGVDVTALSVGQKWGGVMLKRPLFEPLGLLSFGLCSNLLRTLYCQGYPNIGN